MTVKICQIAPYGGVDIWIRIGLQSFPETSKLIVLVNGSPVKPEKKQFINKDNQNLDYVSLADEMLNDILFENSKLPKKKRIDLEKIEIGEKLSIYELVGLFRSLLAKLDDEGYDVVINLSNGLINWRLALYLASLDSVNVRYAYTVSKDNGDIEYIWLHRDLSENERLILDLLNESGPCNLSELHVLFKQRRNKGTIGFISRIVGKMSESHLIEVHRAGREISVLITEIGRAYTTTDGLLNDRKFPIIHKEYDYESD